MVDFLAKSTGRCRAAANDTQGTNRIPGGSPLGNELLGKYDKFPRLTQPRAMSVLRTLRQESAHFETLLSNFLAVHSVPDGLICPITKKLLHWTKKCLHTSTHLSHLRCESREPEKP